MPLKRGLAALLGVCALAGLWFATRPAAESGIEDVAAQDAPTKHTLPAPELQPTTDETTVGGSAPVEHSDPSEASGYDVGTLSDLLDVLVGEVDGYELLFVECDGVCTAIIQADGSRQRDDFNEISRRLSEGGLGMVMASHHLAYDPEDRSAEEWLVSLHPPDISTEAEIEAQARVLQDALVREKLIEVASRPEAAEDPQAYIDGFVDPEQ